MSACSGSAREAAVVVGRSAAIDADAKNGDTSSGGVSLTVVDHSEYVILDKVGVRQFQCINTVTNERFDLPAGVWELAFENGQSALYQPSSADDMDFDSSIIFPGDRFKQVFKHQTGEVFVRDRVGRVESWDVARSKHSTCEVILRGGPTSAELSLACFVFHIPRVGNQSMFWEVAQLYGCLKLESNKGCRSVWVAKGKTRWLPYLSSFVSDMKMFIQSNHGNSKDFDADGFEPLLDRCLPAFSVCTVGFLLLLLRFAYLHKNLGGLEKPAARAAAREVLQAILLPSFEQQAPRTVLIGVVSRFHCSWPRPPRYDAAVIEIRIEGGRLDFGDLQHKAVGRNKRQLENAWWVEMKTLLNNRNPVDVKLQDFLAKCSMSHTLQPLIGQLVLALSVEVEMFFAKASKSGEGHSVVNIRYKTAKEVFSDNMDLHLAEYTLSTVAASHGHKCFSMATDKGTINSLPLQISVIGVPTGALFVCVPQVDYGFDAGDAPAQTGQKRLHDGSLKGSALTERHRAWMNRGQKGVSSDSWRPKKIHRLSAKHWLAHTDSQIRTSTHASGWRFFQKSDAAEWHDDQWAAWPHMAISCDQGSDGVCALFALEYKFQACITKYYDFSHGCHKDLQVALKAVSMWDFILLFMIHANVPHGPDRDDQRFHQLRSAMATAYTVLDETTPLFAALAPMIYQEMKNVGHVWPGEAPLEQEVWAFCRSQDAVSNKDYRLNLNRFQGTVKRAGDILQRWSLDTWERTYLCLENDWLHGAGMKKLILRKGAAELGGEEKQTTSAGTMTLEDRSLRACLQNAMVISTMFVSDRLNYRRLQVFFAVGSIGKEWHSLQNTQLRSSRGSVDFLTAQIGRGQFFDHINSLGACVCKENILEQCGFELPHSVGDIDEVNDKALIDEEMSDLLGQLSMALCVARQRRCLWLVRGWPHRMSGILEPRTAEGVCQEFMSDLATFEELCEMPQKLPIHKTLQSRHCMNLVVNQQYAAALRESRGEPSPTLRAVVEEQRLGPISTQICEDLIGVCKNNDEVKAASKFRRPQVSMAKCITSNTTTTRHKYSAVGNDSRTVRKDAKLPKKAWQCLESDYSLKFQEIATTAPSAAWHSLGATNACARDADLELLKQARSAPGGLRSTRFAWLGEIFELKNRFIFRFKGPGDRQWYMAGTAFPDSSVIAIPMQEFTMLGSSQVYFEPLPMQEVHLLAILDLSNGAVEACAYEWKSWLQQLLDFQRAKELSPAVRCFMKGNIMDLKDLAARSGFFSLGKASVAKYCDYWGVSVNASGTLFETVSRGAQGILKCEKDDLPDIMHQRLMQMHSENCFSEELANCDAAIQTFDIHDHDEVEAQKVRAAKQMSEVDEFLFAYAKVRADSSKGKKKKSTKAIELPHTIQQCEAKRFVPPSASIWMGRTRGEWAGHYKPYRRVSARWSDLGEMGALRKVLQMLWNQHNEYHGLPQNTALVKGLFDGQEMSVGSSSGA